MDVADIHTALADVLKAIANPHRLHLLELLTQTERNVDTLTHLTGLKLSTVSAHLQALKRAGLTTTRRDGTTIYYRITSDDIAELYTVALRVAQTHSPALATTLAQFHARHPTIPTLTLDELAALPEPPYLIDVRPTEEYNAGHYPGAISIPYTELPNRLDDIPTNTTIVLYCRGETCDLAKEAAATLRSRGATALTLTQGVMEWRARTDIHLTQTTHT